MNPLKFLYSKIRLEFHYKFLRRHKFRRKVKKHLLSQYSHDAKIGSNSLKTIIYMADGKILHGGLADRLRGIVSLFKICEDFGWEFRIYFTSPFPLEKYLSPNKYDWRILDSELSYNRIWSLPVYNSCIPDNSQRELKWQRNTLIRQLSPDFKQIHCYNSFFFAEKDFKRIFDILFKPTQILRHQILELKNKVGQEYISISTRFLQLLGDFKETRDIYETLDDIRAEELMKNCLKAIKDIMERIENQGKLVVVTSDSRRFLDYIDGYPMIYSIPGGICHVDSKAEGSEDQLKTFVDFFAIKEAVRSYLVVGQGMYAESNFSKRAAQADGRELIIIDIRERN